MNGIPNPTRLPTTNEGKRNRPTKRTRVGAIQKYRRAEDDAESPRLRDHRSCQQIPETSISQHHPYRTPKTQASPIFPH